MLGFAFHGILSQIRRLMKDLNSEPNRKNIRLNRCYWPLAELSMVGPVRLSPFNELSSLKRGPDCVR